MPTDISLWIKHVNKCENMLVLYMRINGPCKYNLVLVYLICFYRMYIWPTPLPCYPHPHHEQVRLGRARGSVATIEVIVAPLRTGALLPPRLVLNGLSDVVHEEQEEEWLKGGGITVC